jgi:hypothetical protein
MYNKSKILYPDDGSLDIYKNIVFLDCEASGLDPNSYPIEIGFAWINGLTENYLVKPSDNWKSNKTWNPESEKIHKISMDTLLKDGSDGRKVALWVKEIFSKNLIFSDNPAYEAMWIKTLFEEYYIHSDIKILNSNQLVNFVFNKINKNWDDFRDLKEKVNEKFPYTHRASEDALCWAMIIRQSLEWMLPLTINLKP